MAQLKKNVEVFDLDVVNNKGYRYTTRPALSSVLANKRMTEATLDMIDHEVSTIVDIGAGDGTYANDIRLRRSDIKITGFDAAAKAVEMAVSRYPECDWVVGDIADTSTFPKKRFDLGIIRGVLHHLHNPKLAIANSAILSDTLIILEPNGSNPILKLIEKASVYHRKHEETSFTANVLTGWCREGGYEVERIEYIGFVPFFFPAVLAKLIYFFQPCLEKIYPLKRYLGAQIVLLCKKTR